MNEQSTVSRAAVRPAALSRWALSLVVAIVIGAMLIPEVEASKPGKNTIASIEKRIEAQKDNCELIGGGTLTVTPSPFVPNMITKCVGGEEDGKRCTHTPRKTVCTQTLTPLEDIVVPPDEAAALGAPAGGANMVNAPAGGEVAAQHEKNRERHRHGGKGRKK
jgi:hypothetical protein